MTLVVSDPYATPTGTLTRPQGSLSIQLVTWPEMSSELGTITSARSKVWIWVERMLIFLT